MNDIPQTKHQDLVLHNVLLTIVIHDILLFLEYSLRMIRQEWTLGADWPGEVVLRQLYFNNFFMKRSQKGPNFWLCRFIVARPIESGLLSIFLAPDITRVKESVSAT
jgi:hypothetical protein